MGKKIVTICVVGAILLVLELLGRSTIDRMVGGALRETGEIMRMIQEMRYDEAKKASHGLDETWDAHADILELMIDHGTSDDVRFALSRLVAALECGEAPMALIYAGELEGSLEHVLERQTITLQNLL